MIKTTRQKGQKAEQIACRYLQRRGLKLITKNHACRHGEIDLIMQYHHILVFVEVRLRNPGNFVTGYESVTLQKQQRLIKTAQHYLQQHTLIDDIDCRFDVISLTGHHITWIKNAFSADTID